MWYPLKKSVFSLSLASAVLMAVVLAGEPIEQAPQPSTPASSSDRIDAAAITQGATSLADRLPIESAAQREVARAAFGAASLMLIAKLREQQAQIAVEAALIEADAKEKLSEATTAAREARRGAAMPFFSFARWVSPGGERGS